MRHPPTSRGRCEGCRRYAVTYKSSDLVDVTAKAGRGRLRPAVRRRRVYLCWECLVSMGREAEIDVIERTARQAARELPDTIPSDWGAA